MLVSHFGTFDVENYGDLLFPLLVRMRLENIERCELEFVSPVGGEPVFSDSVQSVSSSSVFKRSNGFDAAIVGGGNIIHMIPSTLKSYSDANADLTAYPDLWAGVSLNAPAGAPVIWNAPGVPGAIANEHVSLVRRALQRVDYLAVRDDISRQYLVDACPGIDISVVPDPAWCVSDIWTVGELESVYKNIFVENGLEPPERSVTFHVNKRYVGELSDREVAQYLAKIALSLQAMPILLSIGSCHGDDVFAKDISKVINIPHLLLDSPESLKSIAACISQSEAYIGSSMHGFITAASYGKPAVCVAKNEMIKFKGLADFIGISDLVVESWSELSDNVSVLLNAHRRDKIVSACHRAREELNEHWRKICEVLSAKSALCVQPVGEDGDRRVKHLEYRGEALASTLHMLSRVNKELSFNKRRGDRKVKKIERKVEKIEHNVRSLNARVSQLKGKINCYENSLSWKITKPLRLLSARFPSLSRQASRVLRGTYRRVNRMATVSRSKMEIYDWNPSADIVDLVLDYQRKSLSKNKKIVVYSAIYGGYDVLTLPDSLSHEIDYVCFTDRAINSYGVWKIRSAPYYHPDSTRIARYVKTHPYDLLSEYEVAIWVDANIVIRGDLWKYINKIRHQKPGIGFVSHPLRDCLYDEATACKELNKDKSDLIDKQIERYRKASYPANAGMYETNFFITKLNDPYVKDFFRYWWAEIDLYSRRDQLSVGWALFKSHVKEIKLMPDDVSVRNNEDFTIYRHEIARNFSIPENLKRFTSLDSPDSGVKYSKIKDKSLKLIANVSIDVIICVHNALEDVELCLTAAAESLEDNINIIIVNDMSDDETTAYLRKFEAGNNKVTLLENEINLGYTQSANKGLQASTADFRIMLNSDTIVSNGWALKIAAVAYSSESVGIVGPLSNAASYQSIPRIKGSKGQTAINELPKEMRLDELDLLCEEWSYANRFPRVPLIHGFCFGIKKDLINSIGFFDDVNFKRYYGEENDYCFRARAAGYELSVATNTFVYHRKSRSIDEEERVVHMDKAGKRLRELYGAKNVSLACQQMADHPLLIRMRERSSKYFQ